MKRIEILAPAGSWDTLEAAVKAGADAVYLGGTSFGARAYAENFDEHALVDAIHYAHLHNRKLYMTVNTLVKEEEMDILYAYLSPFYEAGLDAVIVQDMGVLSFVRAQFPDLPVHASTQMTVTNVHSARLLQSLGVTRVVPARELSYAELAAIKQETGLELEVFIHGALCYSYSGQCLLSSMSGGRSGNRGKCAQPCRLSYRLKDGQTGYFLSPKDLCGLKSVEPLMGLGVDSLKIEGRMKNAEYVATAVDSYRRLVDAIYAGTDVRVLIPYLKSRLLETFNRGGFTDGYYAEHNGADMMSVERPNHSGVLLGNVQETRDGQTSFVTSMPLNKQDVLEIALKDGSFLELTNGVAGAAGERVSIRVPKGNLIADGTPIRRVKNGELVKELQGRIFDRPLKEKVKIDVTLLCGKPAIISMTCRNETVSVSGEPVTEAERQPLDIGTVTDKLKKLGNTPFFLAEDADLTVALGEHVFYPMKSLNELRRRCIELLMHNLMTKQMRPARAPLPKASDDIRGNKAAEAAGKLPQAEIPVSCLFGKLHMLPELLRTERVRRFYLDAAFFTDAELMQAAEAIRGAGRELILCGPHIFREDCRQEFDRVCAFIGAYDGLLLRSLDQLALCLERKQEGRIILDSCLYAYNRRAVSLYRELCADAQFVMPRELTGEELASMGFCGQIVDVYGNVPYMVSAQCVQKTTGHCRKQSDVAVLSNGRSKSFANKAVCRYCYSMLYSREPYALCETETQVQALSPAELRYIFLDEIGPVIRDVLDGRPDTAFCSGGHFYKGIE